MLNSLPAATAILDRFLQDAQLIQITGGKLQTPASRCREATPASLSKVAQLTLPKSDER
jgi:hypothetical protein